MKIKSKQDTPVRWYFKATIKKYGFLISLLVAAFGVVLTFFSSKLRLFEVGETFSVVFIIVLLIIVADFILRIFRKKLNAVDVMLPSVFFYSIAMLVIRLVENSGDVKASAITFSMIAVACAVCYFMRLRSVKKTYDTLVHDYVLSKNKVTYSYILNKLNVENGVSDDLDELLSMKTNVFTYYKTLFDKYNPLTLIAGALSLAMILFFYNCFRDVLLRIMPGESLTMTIIIAVIIALFSIYVLFFISKKSRLPQITHWDALAFVATLAAIASIPTVIVNYSHTGLVMLLFTIVCCTVTSGVMIAKSRLRLLSGMEHSDYVKRPNKKFFEYYKEVAKSFDLILFLIPPILIFLIVYVFTQYKVPLLDNNTITDILRMTNSAYYYALTIYFWVVAGVFVLGCVYGLRNKKIGITDIVIYSSDIFIILSFAVAVSEMRVGHYSSIVIWCIAVVLFSVLTILRQFTVTIQNPTPVVKNEDEKKEEYLEYINPATNKEYDLVDPTIVSRRFEGREIQRFEKALRSDNKDTDKDNDVDDEGDED